MSLAAGTRLGPYRIDEAIGAGGMGEVYRATDTRLDRTVAVKVLPPHWADDPDMKQRFDREAQAIASLNHPHICALHDVGREVPHVAPGTQHDAPAPGTGHPAPGTDPVSFLVMEFLEGETLAARIARGPLGLDEALDVAVPIVDALDQAHRKGVIHRDLKPGNIMLTPTGPKLLDFGLARTPVAARTPSGTPAPGSPGSKDPGLHQRPGDAGLRKTPGSNDPGLHRSLAQPVPTTPLTVPGLLIGTLQYMAPEQLEGLQADARTDIFAFGTVLHEMITGKRAFEGRTQVLLISSIATNDPPPLSASEPATPPALEHVAKICLAKNPDERWQTARDLLAALRWIAEGGAAAGVAAPLAVRSSRRRHLQSGLVAAAVLIAALAVPAYSYFTGGVEPVETRYRVWSTPYEDTPHPDGYFAVSPDGRHLVYRGDENGVPDPNGLYVGRIGSVTWRRLPGTDEPTQPFWSPDGRFVAFVANGRLQKIDAAGGPPQVIASASGFYGGAWNAAHVILFGSAAGIQRVSAEGGAVESVTSLGDSETGHYWPHFLPDGRRFLYLAWSGDAAKRGLYVGSLDSADRTFVLAVSSNAAYTEAGHLVFHRDGAVYAQPFDLGRLTLSGEPVRIADGVGFNSSHGFGQFDLSRTGVLVYNQGDSAAAGLGAGPDAWLWQPTRIERSGREISRAGPYRAYRGVEISPDGTRLALHRHEEAGGDVWIVEPTGTDTRLTFQPQHDNSMPIWSPDGKHVVYGSRRDGKWGLYRRLSDGRGTEEALHESSKLVVPMSWSPDGRHIVFGSGDAGNSDLWVLTLESSGGAPAGEPEVFVATPFNETHGQISADGKWIAYASNETRADQYEVYVRPFPEGAGRWQVSPTGGDWPRWSRDGKELYFLAPVPENQASQPGTLYTVKVSARDESFVYGPPADILQFRAINVEHAGGDYPTYAAGPKGEFVVFIRAVTTLPPAGPGGGTAAAAPVDVPPDETGGLTVAVNWERRLRRR